MRRLTAAAALAGLAALGGAASVVMGVAPVVAQADDAKAHAPAPKSRPAQADAGAADTAPPPRRPAEPPSPAAQGRLIPPEEMPPPAPPAAKADAKSPEALATVPPASSGTLIPPEPVAPAGPPVPETLRETDFAHAACRLELRRLGVEYREIPALSDPAQRDCGIARPVEVTAILPGVTLDQPAPMRCETARALAHWMVEVVVPAAGRLPGAPRVTGLSLGTTYQCRGVVGNGTPQNLSEHATGNAIDIAGFRFDTAPPMPITPPGDRGDLAVAFQNAVQGAACLYFTTVLGPGSNAAHEDHLHLDVKARRGGFRLCQ